MDETFCLDYSKLTKNDQRVDVEAKTIPELIHRKRMTTGIATIFHSERRTLTYTSIKAESDRLAASFLSTGLKCGDKILLLGCNESMVFLSILACARAKLIFCLISPHQDAETLKRIINTGSFKAVCTFTNASEHVYSLLKEISPEIICSERGSIKCPALPSLTHIYQYNEDYIHSYTFTFSQILSMKVDHAILPSLDSFDEHSLAALIPTMGSTRESQLAAVSHYQLLGGARSVNHAFRLNKEDKVCVSLPLHRGSLLSLVCFSPFLTECTLVFPDSEPLPANLFQCISYYNLSVLLSNGAALRLALNICERLRKNIFSVLKILLIGERVSSKLQTSIQQFAKHAQIIAVGYVLSETASIPIMGDQNMNIGKLVGRKITGYNCRLEIIKGSKTMGQLFVTPFEGSKFLGFAPDYKEEENWIPTGDIAEMDGEGNINIICPIGDIMYDKEGRIFNHKSLENILCLSDTIKGAQLVPYNSSFAAICVPKKIPFDPHYIKAELTLLCRETGLPIPPYFSFLTDFPRTRTRIQKFRLRQWIAEGKLEFI